MGQVRVPVRYMSDVGRTVVAVNQLVDDTSEREKGFDDVPCLPLLLSQRIRLFETLRARQVDEMQCTDATYPSFVLNK